MLPLERVWKRVGEGGDRTSGHWLWKCNLVAHQGQTIECKPKWDFLVSVLTEDIFSF